MTNLLLFSLLSLISANVLAETRQVESFDQGSCWVDRSREGIIEVASFNDERSFKFSTDNLEKVQELIEKDVPEFSLEGSQIKSSVHCSSQGTQVVLKLTNQNKNICLWFKPTKNELKVSFLGAAIESNNSYCDGLFFGKAIIGVREDENLRNEVIEALENGIISSMVKDYKVGSFGLITIELKRSAYFKELEFKRLMEQFDGVAYVDFNWHGHAIGEFVPFEILPKKE
jgi:hypothetical protein